MHYQTSEPAFRRQSGARLRHHSRTQLRLGSSRKRHGITEYIPETQWLLKNCTAAFFALAIGSLLLSLPINHAAAELERTKAVHTELQTTNTALHKKRAALASATRIKASAAVRFELYEPEARQLRSL